MYIITTFHVKTNGPVQRHSTTKFLIHNFTHKYTYLLNKERTRIFLYTLLERGGASIFKWLTLCM